MSFKQFNIYNRVHAPDYKDTGAKSYGSNSFTTTDVVVGTSKVNSHDFLTHETKVITNDNNTKTFQFFVDGMLIKQAIYCLKDKKITTVSALQNNNQLTHVGSL